MKKLRVGVVGVGHIGTNHARLYAEIPAADFTAVYDVDLARASAIVKKYGSAATKSLEEFAELVDAASISTPTRSPWPRRRPPPWPAAGELTRRGP